MRTLSGLILAACLGLGACAPMVQRLPSRLDAIDADRLQMQRIRLAHSAEVKLDTGYTRMLPAASVWALAGHITQGDVYKPVNSVFTIEGSQVHEAWLVIRSGMLNGFYLPGEQMYSPLSSPLPLSLERF